MSLVSLLLKERYARQARTSTERGRIIRLVQNIIGLGNKKVEYVYNANGQVSVVWYQDGRADAFYHFAFDFYDNKEHFVPHMHV